MCSYLLLSNIWLEPSIILNVSGIILAQKSYEPFLTLLEKARAQWLSGRVLDSRPKGRGFEPHRRHWVVVLEQDTFILA